MTAWKSEHYDDLYHDDGRCKVCLSLIIVTRGDVDLAEVKRINEWVCVTETIVWDNSIRQDLGVYGRYAAIEETTEAVVLVVDDDVALGTGVEELVASYQPGHVVCNMPERFRPHYPDSALVGFGAIFDRDLPEQAFKRFLGALPPSGPWYDRYRRPEWGDERIDELLFHRECDTVFTALTPCILVDTPYTDMPWADAPNRLWKQREHFGERRRMLNLARKVRDA